MDDSELVTQGEVLGDERGAGCEHAAHDGNEEQERVGHGAGSLTGGRAQINDTGLTTFPTTTVVAGPAILLPRVGLPVREGLRPVYLRSRVQLSDCVIALRLDSMKLARAASQLLVAKYAEQHGALRSASAHALTTGTSSAFSTNSAYARSVYSTHNSGTIVLTSDGIGYSITRSQ